MLQLGSDPVVSGVHAMNYAGTAIVFLAVLIAVAGIGFRLVQRPASTPPPIPASPAQVNDLPYCSNCKHRTAATDVCPICGFNFAAPKKSAVNALWPVILDEKGARQAAKQGMWAAFFCAGATTLIVLLQHGGMQFMAGVNDLALLDAGAFALLGMGIRNMSRGAAAGALGLYLIERVVIAGHAGAAGVPIPMILAITLAFVTGVRGTFTFHKLRAPATPVIG